MLKFEPAPNGAAFGSVRVSARIDAHPLTPVPDILSGEVGVIIAMDQPPTVRGGRHERRSSTAVLAVGTPSRQSLPSARCHLTITLPAQVLHGIGMDDAGVFALDTQSALFWPVLSFAWACATVEERHTGLTLYYTERLLQEMVTGWIVASLGVRAAGGETQAFAAAMSMIVARVGDPDLTPAVLAGDLNVSLRTLQRQFSAHGSTIERSIRHSRVEHAISLLQDRTYDSLTIDRVAQACGLSNGSSLARAFAAEGHDSPSAIRSHSRTLPHLPPSAAGIPLGGSGGENERTRAGIDAAPLE